jgi:hypothetical protein
MLRKLPPLEFASQHWKVKAAVGDIFLNGGRPVGTRPNNGQY